jgi:hypothetical protein
MIKYRHSCAHEEFSANVQVARIEDTGRFNAEVKIHCVQCGEKFCFLGLPAGSDPNGASVSADGTEARLAIGTKETVASILTGSSSGYTIRRVV